MISVNIRKQGGAAIMTIPSDVLRRLNLSIGSTLELNVTDDGFSVHPVSRNHYTLDELLEGATPRNLKQLNEETKWAREGDSIGRELT